MKGIILPHNHISITSAGDVKTICSPLFGHSEIDYFSYVKFYKNNLCTVFSTNSEYHHAVFANGYIDCLKKIIFPEKDSLDICYQLSESIEPETCSFAKKTFGIKNIFEVVYTYKDYCEIFEFGSSNGDSKIIDYYFNNLEAIKRFNLYFKEKARSLIMKAESSKILIPYEKRPQISLVDNINSDNFCIETKVKKYHIFYKDNDVTITHRELECLQYLSKGNSSKQIANILGISNRTIETHIINLKNKLNIYTTSQLKSFYTDYLERLF